MRSSKSCKVIATHNLISKDIAIVADSHVTRELMGVEEGWKKVIAGKTKVKVRCFIVMAHSVRTDRIKVANQEKALTKTQAQNSKLNSKVRFLRVAWQKKKQKDRKLKGLLHLEVGTPEEANTLVTEGLVLDQDLKNCVLFFSECQMTLCFCCQGYGNIAASCRKPETCGVCAQ